MKILVAEAVRRMAIHPKYPDFALLRIKGSKHADHTSVCLNDQNAPQPLRSLDDQTLI